MYLDLGKVTELVEKGLVRVQQYKDADLFLANYTHLANHGNYWEEEPILRHCRGIIYNSAGKVLYKPLKKFWNLGEKYSPTLQEAVAFGHPEVTDKVDGSAGLLYFSGQEWRIATRGSFFSEQAIEATKMLHEYHEDALYQLLPSMSYFFEIVYPENKIVVNYHGMRSLLLLAVIDTESGVELPYSLLHIEAKRLGFSAVHLEENYENIEKLQTAERDNFEGWVLFWPQEQRRVKVKLDEYVRLHHLISTMSEESVWAILSNGESVEPVANGLDTETAAWVRIIASRMEETFVQKNKAILAAFDEIVLRGLDLSDRKNRGEIARFILATLPKDCTSAAFALLDNKDYKNVLWKALRPEGRGERPSVTRRLINHEVQGDA